MFVQYSLRHSISSVDTELEVISNIQDIPSGGILTIGTEQMSFSRTSDTKFLQLVRGINSTVAASHAAKSVVTINNILIEEVAIPLLTTVERDLITPVEGLVIYNTTTHKLQVRTDSAWVDASGSGGGSGTPNIVTFTDNGETDTTGTVYVPATSTVTIAASSNTAQIKITASGLGQNDNNGAPTNRSFWTIFKDSVTDLSGGSSLAAFSCQSASGTSLVPIIMSVLDTPGDTNPHTYTVYFKSNQDGQDTSWGSSLQLSIITAEEVH